MSQEIQLQVRDMARNFSNEIIRPIDIPRKVRMKNFSLFNCIKFF